MLQGLPGLPAVVTAHGNFALYPRWHIRARAARARPYEVVLVVRPQRRDAQRQHTNKTVQQPAQHHGAVLARAPAHQQHATKAGITTN